MPGHMRHGHGPATEKAKDFKGAVIKVVRYIAHDKLALFVAIACAVGSVAFNVMGPRVLGEATTELFRGIAAKVGGAGGVDFTLIGRILATVLCIYITSSVLSLVQGWLMTGVTQRVCYRLRRQIIEKIDRMPLAYFERVSTGDVMSRVTNDVDTLGQSLNQSVTQLITSVAQLVGVSVQMLSISVALAGVTFLTIPLSLLGVVLVVRASQRHFRRQQAFLGSANGIIEESFAGQTLIQAYNRAERALGEFDEVNEKLYESGWRAQFLSGVMQPIMGLVGNLGYVAVVMMSAFLMISGRITVGNAQAFFQYIRNFTQPITQLSQVSNMLQMLAAAAERIFEFLDEDEEDDPAPLSEPLRATGSVEFDHVRFGYVPEKTVIHDFNCSVQPGQTVAIVGPTGAGVQARGEVEHAGHFGDRRFGGVEEDEPARFSAAACGHHEFARDLIEVGLGKDHAVGEAGGLEDAARAGDGVSGRVGGDDAGDSSLGELRAAIGLVEQLAPCGSVVLRPALEAPVPALETGCAVGQDRGGLEHHAAARATGVDHDGERGGGALGGGAGQSAAIGWHAAVGRNAAVGRRGGILIAHRVFSISECGRADLLPIALGAGERCVVGAQDVRGVRSRGLTRKALEQRVA